MNSHLRAGAHDFGGRHFDRGSLKGDRNAAFQAPKMKVWNLALLIIFNYFADVAPTYVSIY